MLLFSASCVPGALSWNQLNTVASTLKTAASGSQLLVTDAAELMLKLGSSANPALPYPWQACFSFLAAPTASSRVAAPSLHDSMLKEPPAAEIVMTQNPHSVDTAKRFTPYQNEFCRSNCMRTMNNNLQLQI